MGGILRVQPRHRTALTTEDAKDAEETKFEATDNRVPVSDATIREVIG